MTTPAPTSLEELSNPVDVAFLSCWWHKWTKNMIWEGIEDWACFNLQIAFCLMVYPSVMLTYAGQTAYLIKHPQDHSQGFFKMIPKTVFWPMFVVSTLAAIVASQGLISATFSIVKQSVALDYFPRVKLVHTSKHKEGQIYSPEINYILMVLCLAIVFGFRKSSEIGNAFGKFRKLLAKQLKFSFSLLHRIS